jgi:hypothetical protein
VWRVLCAVCVGRHVFVGEFKFGIAPRDSTIRQVNKRDLVLVGLLVVLVCLVC